MSGYFFRLQRFRELQDRSETAQAESLTWSMEAAIQQAGSLRETSTFSQRRAGRSPKAAEVFQFSEWSGHWSLHSQSTLVQSSTPQGRRLFALARINLFLAMAEFDQGFSSILMHSRRQAPVEPDRIVHSIPSTN